MHDKTCVPFSYKVSYYWNCLKSQMLSVQYFDVFRVIPIRQPPASTMTPTTGTLGAPQKQSKATLTWGLVGWRGQTGISVTAVGTISGALC